MAEDVCGQLKCSHFVSVGERGIWSVLWFALIRPRSQGYVARYDVPASAPSNAARNARVEIAFGSTNFEDREGLVAGANARLFCSGCGGGSRARDRLPPDDAGRVAGRARVPCFLLLPL